MLGNKWILFLLIAATLPCAAAFADTIDFESGTDGALVPDTAVMVFNPTGGHDWVFGDWRTNKYNGKYPNKPYWSQGNFFAWMGKDQPSGKITFPNLVSHFTVNYASPEPITIKAFNRFGIMLDSDTGVGDLNSGRMNLLTVEATDISYVIIGVDSIANYWIIDNASSGCLANSECDDGTFCNGAETCVDGTCTNGTPIDCSDDGQFCNGEEFCNETTQRCDRRNVPTCRDDNRFCNGEEFCDETLQSCSVRNAPDCSDDGLACNGEEFCNEVTKACDKRNPIVCTDDGLFCNGEEACDEATRTCTHINEPSCRNDGLFCNGEEICDEQKQMCSATDPPDCVDDGIFCNGQEVCDETTRGCTHSGDPCTPDKPCVELTKSCQSTVQDIPTGGDETGAGWPKGTVSGGCCGG